MTTDCIPLDSDELDGTPFDSDWLGSIPFGPDDSGGIESPTYSHPTRRRWRVVP